MFNIYYSIIEILVAYMILGNSIFKLWDTRVIMVCIVIALLRYPIMKYIFNRTYNGKKLGGVK